MQGHLNPALGIEGWYFLLFLHPFNVVFIEILKNADSSKQRKKKKEEKRWDYALQVAVRAECGTEGSHRPLLVSFLLLFPCCRETTKRLQLFIHTGMLFMVYLLSHFSHDGLLYKYVFGQNGLAILFMKQIIKTPVEFLTPHLVMCMISSCTMQQL